MAADEGPAASVFDAGEGAADGSLDAAGVDDGGPRLEFVRVEANPVDGRLRGEGDEDDVGVADIDGVPLVETHDIVAGPLGRLVKGAAN